MATDAAPAGEWDAATSVQLNRQAYMMCFLSIKRIYAGCSFLWSRRTDTGVHCFHRREMLTVIVIVLYPELARHSHVRFETKGLISFW